MAKRAKKAYNTSGDKALALEVLGQFRVIYGAVKGQHRNVEQSCGISGAQLWILREVHAHPDIGVSDVAQRLSIHQSTCSLLVEKLASKGYIARVRSPEDNRRVGLTLTKRGMICLGKAPGPAEGLLPKALTELSPASLRALRSDLRKVIGKLAERDSRYSKQPLSDL